jgi:hypothetical protein
MDVKEFKKRVRSVNYNCQIYVTFLDESEIFKNFGNGKNPELYDNYHSRNRLKRRLIVMRKMTEYLPYQCDFDKKGDCRETRKKDSHWKNYYGKNNKCCCVSCASEIGYIKMIPQRAISKYAECFDSKTGFWKEGEGCRLPRELRSDTCLRYSCSPDKEFKDMLFSYGITIRGIEDELNDLQRTENRIKRIEKQKTA